MTAIGLAVAAIPEGLPAIVTIVLSIGVTKMAKKNAIVRKLPSVETLGSSQIICTDKTGTLTQNKMKVVNIFPAETKKYILELASMCNNSNIVINNGEETAEGEPTENAIINAALEQKIDKRELIRNMPIVSEIPFESSRKLMTTIHKIYGGYRVITKGAPDILLNICSISKEEKENIKNQNKRMAKDALRVLGIAYKDISTLPIKINSENIEKELKFVGLIGMIDPPRNGVKEAVETCNKAGIKTVMITGDQIDTANAIATQLGILKKSDCSISGNALNCISQKDLEKTIMNYSVFARVTPEHKVRIVKAFRSNRENSCNDRRPE